MSTMSAQEFIEHKAALGLNRKQLAEALGKSGPTITGYENGNRIPVDVVQGLIQLLDQEREKIKAQDGVLLNRRAGLGSMIVHQNTVRKRPELHQTLGRFFRRQRPPDTRVYPVYRMSRERFMIYADALSKWQTRVRELAYEYTDEARQRDYVLELADLRSLADTAPRNAPYDIHIQRNEWDVVSRALRHLGTDAANNLRIHWNKYKVVGFPRNRANQPSNKE